MPDSLEDHEPAAESEAAPIPAPEPMAEATPLPAEQPEPAEPQIEAAAEPVPEIDDEIVLPDEPEAAFEPEAVEPEADQADQIEQEEAESEPPENISSGAKTLVDSIASIFTRRHAPSAKTSILGLREVRPSSTEPWEPVTPQAESLPSAEVDPTLAVPWEPPPQKIEFTAKSAAELEAEPETKAAERPLPASDSKPAEPEPFEPKIEPPFGPDDPLWPPRR
jgi:hypothetical protein